MDNKQTYEVIERRARRRTTVRNVIVYLFLGLWALMVLFPF